MTIYDIKYQTLKTAPHYFSRESMKFFGQTLKDFKVYKIDNENYHFIAPMKDRHNNNKIMGYSERIFNTITKELRIPEDTERLYKRSV